MSDYDDRGAYTPPSDRLAFDPRQPVRGGGPAPVTLIVSALALVGVVGGVFFLYRDGFRHRGETPALVGAPVADARSPAAAPPTDANAAPAGLVVDRATAPAPAPAFAPPPPQPLPRLAAAAPPPAAPSAAPLAAAKPAPPAPRVVMLAPEAPPKPAVAPPKQLAVTATPRLALAAPPAEHPAVRHFAPITIASLTDDALAHRMRPAVRPTHDDQAPRTRFAEAPSAAPPPAHHAVAVRIKGAQSAAAPSAVASPSAAWVQIGAFSSQTLAEQGWRDVARIERSSMAGKGRAVQPMERDDGATLYRTYVTGFASVTAAQAFCAELQAAARACIVK
jgi:SPOR domain